MSQAVPAPALPFPPSPEFELWVASLPKNYWARYDLSACRLGWEAARAALLIDSDDAALCRERAMTQWESSLKRPDLDEHARVGGAIDAYERQALALRMLTPWLNP